MALATPSQPLSEGATASGSRRTGLVLGLGALGLFGLGAAFWVANGPRTFGELMLGAFSWCF